MFFNNGLGFIVLLKEMGKSEGRKEERINIAKKLLDVLDDETIAIKTELSIDVIRNLRKS